MNEDKQSADLAGEARPGDALMPLTDGQIDKIAENIVKSMPDGISGFCKTWGWRQFARDLLDVCAGHYRAAPAPVAQYGWVWVDVDEGGCFVYPHEHHPKDAIAVYTAAPAPVLTPAQSWREAAQWLRNNYQDHPNIASLCDAMTEYGSRQ